MNEEKRGGEDLSPQEIALRQLKYTKRIFCVNCVIAVSVILILINMVVSTAIFNRRFRAIYSDLIVINTNMKEISGELSDLDLKELSSLLSDTLETSNQAMSIARDTMSELDTEELNKSIHSLNEALQPLIRLFGGGN